MSIHADLVRQLEDLASDASDAKTFMQRLADKMHSVMPRYNSVSSFLESCAKAVAKFMEDHAQKK